VRYYKITITNPTTGAIILPSSLMGLPISSLLPSGLTNTSALNVELDIPVSAFNAPNGQAWVRIWGLGIKDLTGAFNLGPTPTTPGALVTVEGGMAQGLPLANPAQRNVLLKGQVYQCFGNWIGTAQTVDLILVAPSSGSSATPTNYTLNWKQGTTLATALANTLKTALPNAKQNIQISPRLVLNHDQQAFYGSLTQLSQLLNPFSKSVVTDANYQGVSISYDGTTVTAYDGSTPPKSTTTIQFQDLIGQPTWIEANTIQIKCPMRGDINLFDMLALPPGAVTSSSSAFQNLTGNNPANNLTFTGPYQVVDVHHYGNFRQSDAASWNTTIKMVKPP
jgi:hypothetical protein